MYLLVTGEQTAERVQGSQDLFVLWPARPLAALSRTVVAETDWSHAVCSQARLAAKERFGLETTLVGWEQGKVARLELGDFGLQIAAVYWPELVPSVGHGVAALACPESLASFASSKLLPAAVLRAGEGGWPHPRPGWICLVVGLSGSRSRPAIGAVTEVSLRRRSQI